MARPIGRKTSRARLTLAAKLLNSVADDSRRKMGFEMTVWYAHRTLYAYSYMTSLVNSDRPKCGTSACAAGFCALNPAFNALGLTLDRRLKAPSYRGLAGFDSLAAFFGINTAATDWFFEARSYIEAERNSPRVVADRITQFLALTRVDGDKQ